MIRPDVQIAAQGGGGERCKSQTQHAAAPALTGRAGAAEKLQGNLGWDWFLTSLGNRPHTGRDLSRHLAIAEAASKKKDQINSPQVAKCLLEALRAEKLQGNQAKARNL